MSVCVLVGQLYLTLSDLMDRSLPGHSLHGVLQARVLKWVTISFAKGSSQPRDWTQVSCISVWATRGGKKIFDYFSNTFPLGIAFQVGGFISHLSTLDISLHSLPSCIFSNRKSAVTLMFFSLCITCFFFFFFFLTLVAFKTFFLSLVLSILLWSALA